MRPWLFIKSLNVTVCWCIICLKALSTNDFVCCFCGYTQWWQAAMPMHWSPLLLCPQTAWLPQIASWPIWPDCEGVDPYDQKQVRCQWKYMTFYWIQFWHQSWLWIGPCHCFPKRSTPNDLPHLAVYRRSGLQWLETSSIKMSMNTQWQWFIFDQIQFRHTAMPVYWSLLLFPQIDWPRWLPHLVDSRRSEPQLVIVVWPWLQCQRKFVSAGRNIFSFDWRNHMTRDLSIELIEIKLQ